MTKFTKTILTFGLLIGIGVGGKYGYDYMKDHGYFDDVVKTNVSAETVAEINDFLNDDYKERYKEIVFDRYARFSAESALYKAQPRSLFG